MAGYKETPRQKMIGMMYLVLTALLALNVSKQILDSFVVVNESMELTNSNFSKKLANTYSKFEAQYASDSSKVGPYWKRAVKARKLSLDLEKFVDSIKFTVLMKSTGIKSYDSAKILPLNKVKRPDDYNEPTNYFLGTSEDGSEGQGKVLKARIEEYKKQMLSLVDPNSRNNIKMGLETQGNYQDANKKSQNWIQHNFYHTIIAATVTILNKIKAEVYNAEFDVVNSIISEVSAKDYKFDVIKAKVIPESRFVFSGDTYNAEIIVAAYETKGKITGKWVPGVETLTAANEGSGRPLEGPNGVVNLSIPAGGVGAQRFAGFLEVLDPISGKTQNYPFSEEYIVAKRSVSISPTLMMVFYKGIKNPLKIVVPGGATDVQATISTGTVTKKDAESYIVDVPAPKTGGPKLAIVTVSAVYGGQKVNLGSESFRLKDIPEPDVSINGILVLEVNKQTLLGSNKGVPMILANRPDGFDLTVSYEVVSFKMYSTTTSNKAIGLSAVGPKLSEEMKAVLQTARPNQQIMIYDINVKAPGMNGIIQKTISYKII